MASKKLFITGATGYIGGAVLIEVLKRHGQVLNVTALLRSPSKEFSEKHPQVSVVKGSFDDFDVISKAAAEADIVIRMPRSSCFTCPSSQSVHSSQMIDASRRYGRHRPPRLRNSHPRRCSKTKRALLRHPPVRHRLYRGRPRADLERGLQALFKSRTDVGREVQPPFMA